jgi:L-gulonate 3-dehydrogenase
VSIYDDAPQALEKCLATLQENLRELAEEGLLNESQDTVLRRITPVRTLQDAVQNAILVQENVREALEVKQSIFSEMDRLAVIGAVLASSTSWIPASSFSAGLRGRNRIIVAHPVNPPHLVPLVELAPAPWTAVETVERAREVYVRAGQIPVLLKKEITGFLLNRIQGAVLNEVLNLYEGDFASIEDLDNVMKHGLGMRWSFMGPFETIDLNAPGGVSDYALRYGKTYRDIARRGMSNEWNSSLLERAQTELRATLPDSDVERRTRRRDRQLMAQVRHKQRRNS